MNLGRLRYGTRLTIVYTAIFALALLAFSALAFAMVWWSLGSSTAARVQSTVDAIGPIPDIRHGRIALDPDDRRQMLGILSENRVNGAAVAADGSVLLESGALPAPARAAIAGSASREVRTGGGYVVATEPIVTPNGAVVGHVVTWTSTAANDEVARVTLGSLLVASATIVIVAGIVGGLVIRRMLQPIVDLNAMISHIEAADLSERLAWSGPDDELGRLCTTFDRLLDRLEAAFERERRFTANASHELRTPLAVMRAEIELTLTRERDDATYRATFRRLQLETNRLEALVESLLLTARSDAGLAAASAHPLRDVAERAVSRLSPIAAERDVECSLRAERDAWAVVDVMLLESAIVAVLDNALRYTPAGKRITVVIGERDGSATLAVVDGGDGFTPEALDRATQRFWRDDRSRSGTGMGLGLAIVAAIVERHGGTIDLRNDGGGIVEIRLPAVEPPQEWANSGVIGNTAGSPA